MPIKGAAPSAETIIDKRRLDALGVLLPIRLHELSFLPGRRSLGRAGEGMRFLRMRPYEAGQDNPRDIDKFSPEGEYWINEWDSEAQAVISLYADASASISTNSTAAVRNLALLQLTYSLWRAGDRVRTTIYGSGRSEEFAERNLKSQLDRLAESLGKEPVMKGEAALDALSRLATRKQSVTEDLVFLISNFKGDRPGKLHHFEDWQALLRILTCDVVPVIVSFELSTNQVGAVKLWDPERNRQRLVLLTPGRAQRINDDEAARVAELEQMFRRLGLDSMTLRTEHDVYPALAALARLRRKRRT